MLRDELPWLQTSVPADSFRLVKLVWDVSKENETLVEEIGVLEKTTRKELAARAVVAKEFIWLTGSVLSFH